MVSWALGCSLWVVEGVALAATSFQPTLGDPLLAPWRWRTFPELNGLGLRCLLEAGDRTMWFGLEEGVTHYDGLRWTTYGAAEGLPGTVECLALGPEGLYAGGTDGLSQFRQGRWSRLFPPAGQVFAPIRRLTVARDGSLWAATDWGALRGRNGDFVLYTGPEGQALARSTNAARVRVELLPSALLRAPRGQNGPANRSKLFEVYEDRQARIWLGTDEGEVISHTPASPPPGPSEAASLPPPTDQPWRLYNEADGLGCDLRPRFLQVADGSIWVVFQGVRGRAHQFDGTRWKSLRLADLGAPDSSDWLLQTKDGVLWIGCHGALCAYRQGALKVYEPPQVPIPSVRTFLCQSSDGALWVGGQGAEVLRLDYQTPRWTVYQDLNFQWESPAGARWFLHRTGQVIVQEGTHWTAYGVAEGLMDAPVALLGTRSGEVWAAGSHQGTAATARFARGQWTRFLHERLSWGVDWRALFEAADGSLWFGGAVNYANLGRAYVGGVMQYRQGQWLHHQFGMTSFYGLAQSPEGRIWGGWDALWSFDGQKWQPLPDSPEHRLGRLELLFTSRQGHLWVGTRQFGLFCYDDRQWVRHHVKDGLLANTIRSLTQSPDGTLWVATDRGISRYDGHRWTAGILPDALNMPREGGALKAAPSGALWINRSSRNWNRRAWPQAPQFDLAAQEFWTVCYQGDPLPPKTSLTLGLERVSPPGNVVLAWKGTDGWNVTPEKDLQYSYRLDAGPWSAFAGEQSHTFLSLRGGRHHFEVRARDRDFNVDPVPATLDFQVLPPVWRQAWFITLIAALLGVILALTFRVIQRGRRLRQTNRALAAEVEKQTLIGSELQLKQGSLESANRRLELEMQERHKAAAALQTKVTELRDALTQIKTLRGIVPICAGCKKIRDDKGYWEQVESYVTKHSHAQFSHGLCPECLPKYFPDGETE